ncbi:hypothetical protein P4H66_02275 [Paenibacillus dokdonensis]|uniref:Uncharacterized protein n=1 Tax=Paenibacillus dokdonensis TaxID=2567944 RepID=A0ABU6GG46_9BACL|nr:hypothetical protein [Paenibacillus dokdonensis]MEC0238700.1 hypothetical protein [Paenibacillus dokdonensis]
MLQIIHVGKQSRRIRQEEVDCEEGSSAVIFWEVTSIDVGGDEKM